MAKIPSFNKYRLWPSVFGCIDGQGDDESYNWKDYLDKSDFEATPVHHFPHAPRNSIFHGIIPGIKCEVPNVYYWEAAISIGGVYWVATIIKIAGYKALMRYEGFGEDSSQDFWMNLCSSDLHHVGWCSSEGKPLVIPKPLADKPPQEQPAVDWKAFLVKKLTGSKIIDNISFQTIIDKERASCKFRPGHMVEVIDRNSLDRYRMGVVKRIIGQRFCVDYLPVEQEAAEVALKVKSDDPAQLAVFKSIWCHVGSSFAKPFGWSYKIGARLYCSENYRIEYENKCKQHSINLVDATEEYFQQPSHKLQQSPDDFSPLLTFDLNMKLEAIDVYNNFYSISPATVTKLYKHGAMEITYDGSSFAFLVDKESPFIFPVGYCDAHNIKIEPPEGYTKTFHWKTYLRETNSLGAPQVLFDQPTENHFRVGQKLEATDNVDPHLVCVTTVAESKGRLVRIHYDGWADEYDQWFDASSPELFPIGWCEMVGYALEHPIGGSGVGGTAVSQVVQSRRGKKSKKAKKSRSNADGAGESDSALEVVETD